jgi:hypothetical protein
MTKDEALKMALEALEDAAYCVQKNYCPDKMGHDWDDTITAIKEALAQPTLGYAKKIEELIQERDALRALAQPVQERYFCQRCGKPVNLTTIHTCTPPT